MSMKEIEEAISSNSLPLSVAEKYLKLYIADINWSEHIAALWKNSMNKFSNETEAKDHIKRAVACATILPLVENTPIPDPPSNLLFWCTAWKQFYRDDWFKIFIDVLKEDLEISKNRNKIITLGIVEPIDIAPMTRQAYNWLYESAVSHDCINDSNREDIENKLKSISSEKIGVLLFQNKVKTSKPIVQYILSPTGDFKEASKNLYSYLHELDALGLDLLLIEKLPNINLGKSINDRLNRAVAEL